MMNSAHEFWDSLTYGAGGTYFGIQALQLTNLVNMEAMVNIIAGISIAILALVRSYYWIKNRGYIDRKAQE